MTQETSAEDGRVKPGKDRVPKSELQSKSLQAPGGQSFLGILGNREGCSSVPPYPRDVGMGLPALSVKALGGTNLPTFHCCVCVCRASAHSSGKLSGWVGEQQALSVGSVATEN